MTSKHWIQRIIEGRSLTALAQSFLAEGGTRSTIAVPIADQVPELDDMPGYRAVAMASFEMCSAWTKEWFAGVSPDVWIAQPTLLVPATENTDVEPGGFVLSSIQLEIGARDQLFEEHHMADAVPAEAWIPGINLVAVVSTSDWLSYRLRRWDDTSFVFAEQRGVESSFDRFEEAIRRADNQTQRDLLDLLCGCLSICAYRYCHVTRSVGTQETDSRLSALTEFQSILFAHRERLRWGRTLEPAHQTAVRYVRNEAWLTGSELDVSLSMDWALFQSGHRGFEPVQSV